jgi:hypothetical protein
MKKCTCGSRLNGFKCDDCGKEYQSSEDNKKHAFWGYCCTCGIRGRNIKNDKEKTEYWCYECYRADQRKKIYHAEYTLTRQEQEYAEAMKVFILKPQFYLEQPDYVSFQYAVDKFSHYELAKFIKERDMPKNSLSNTVA